MARTKKRWSDFTGPQQALIVSGAVVEVVVTSIALVDIARRPSSQVRGFKPLWLMSFVVQPVGPLAYLAVGRRDDRS